MVFVKKKKKNEYKNHKIILNNKNSVVKIFVTISLWLLKTIYLYSNGLAVWRNGHVHRKKPLKMSMMVCFQSPKSSIQRAIDHIPRFPVNCRCCVFGSHPDGKWKTHALLSMLYIDPLKCKERTREHKDVPLFRLGCYWGTGTGRDSRYCYGHRWGYSLKSYCVKWNSGLDLRCDLECSGDSLEVFQKRVPDWPPFAATPPVSAASDTWMRWTPPAAVKKMCWRSFDSTICLVVGSQVNLALNVIFKRFPIMWINVPYWIP